ncbi:MAG: YceI family protein [Burkholderiales bacterium]
MTKTLLAAALCAACGMAQAETATYTADPLHTNVTWEVLHSGTSTIRGRFAVKEATITLDRAAKTGKVDVGIDPATVTTIAPSLESTMKGERMFNVAAFPSVRFAGESVTFDGDKVTSVTGNLTLLGKTQPLTLQAIRFNCYQHPMLKREVCGGDFEGVIQRSQYGLGFLPQAAAENVRVLVQIEAIRQQ